MKYEYLKGSEKDFEGAPEWATLRTYIAHDSEYFVERHEPGARVMRISDRDISEIYEGDATTIKFDNIDIIAERRPITEPSWDGVVLLPVGTKVEWMGHKYGWLGGTIAAYDEKYPSVAIIRHNDGYTGCHRNEIRTEADKKREKSIIALAGVMPDVTHFKYGEKMSNGDLIGSAWYELYDAIAAGKIPGVKLED